MYFTQLWYCSVSDSGIFCRVSQYAIDACQVASDSLGFGWTFSHEVLFLLQSPGLASELLYGILLGRLLRSCGFGVILVGMRNEGLRSNDRVFNALYS